MDKINTAKFRVEHVGGVYDIEAITVGAFTIVCAYQTINGRQYSALGVARKSDKDPHDVSMGVRIALGRALKALELRASRRPVVGRYMA